MNLRNHQADAEQHQPGAGVIDRQQVERVEREQECDGADGARHHSARRGEFEHQAVDADQHQDERDVGVGDDGEEIRAPARRALDDLQSGGVQRHLLPIDDHRAPVDLAQQVRNIIGDYVDDVELERLGGGNTFRAAHRLLGPFHIALVQLGKAADIGGRVVDDLARLGVGRPAAGRLLLGFLRLLFAAAE